MAITEYHSPEKITPQQSYVEQFVPLPYEVLARAAQNRQNLADKNVANADALMQALEVPVRPQDREDHRAYVDNVRQQIDSVIDSYNGDASLASKELRSIIREQQSSMTGGDLAIWKADELQRQKYIADQDKLFQEDKIDSITRDALIAEESRNYGLSKGDQLHGQFSGITGAEQFDYNKLLDEFGKGWKAEAKDKGMYWNEADNTWMRKTGSRTEYVDPNEVITSMGEYLSADPRFAAEMAQAKRLGTIPPDLDATVSAMARKYGFAKKQIIDEI